MPVRKPPPPPDWYLAKYYRNFMRRGRGLPPDESIVGKCFQCGKGGVLAYDLVHVGPVRATNLLCRDCRKDM